MDGYSADGKKRIISFSAATKAEVLDKIRDYQNKKDAHIHVDKKLTLSNWADLWYCDYKSQGTGVHLQWIPVYAQNHQRANGDADSL